MQDVGVRFSGSAAGAVGAARETATAIDKVKVSAAGSSVPLRGMEKDLGRVERGALAGSGAFHGLGRSVAFASTAFIGAAGLVEVVKSSIDVVLRSQTSIALLDRAVTNAHASVKALTPILEDHAAKMRLLGFNDDQTREAEAKLVTAFGATKKALDEVKVAADLARATNTDLGTAARQLILLQEGNARAAKQFGLTLPDLTKKQWEAKAAMDGLTLAQEKGKTLYDELLPRIHAQSDAYANSPAGKIAEFHAQVQHLEESIGTGLLPVVDKYLTSVDDWLSKGKNQKRVTDDVKKVVGELTGVLGDAKQVMHDVLPVAKDVAGALGGWKRTIELIIGLKFASMLSGWAGALSKVIGSEAAGTGLLGAGGAAKGLLGRLKALTLSPWVIPIALSFIPPDAKGQAALDKAGIGFLGHLPVIGGFEQQIGRLGAYTFGGNLTGDGSPTSPKTLSKQQKIVTTALLLGPNSGAVYETGGTGGVIPGVSAHPQIGFDCSGYLYEIYKQNGIDIPRTSEEQFNDPNAQQVAINDLQPGDGVYFVGSPKYAPPGHCGIYIGGGRFIEYYQSGKPARVSQLSGYPGYMGARRWIGIKQQTTGSTTTKSPFGPDLTKHTGTTTTTTKPKGATEATIITAQGRVTALLKGLPANLDPVEKNARSHILAIQDSLHIHMTPAELAKDRVELTRWGKVLHDEITKNAKVIAAAAATAKKTYDQALSLDVSHVLRDFDESFQAQVKVFDTETSRHLRDMQTAFSRQQLAFDRETQRGLAKFVVKQTPEEKALADFVAARAAADQAKSRADQLASAATPEEKAALSLGFSLDDQQAALQASADQSRTAQDAKTTADQQAYQDQRDAQKQALQDQETDREQAYQDQRDAQKQALQDINDDQKIALQQSLDDWVQNLEDKKASWTAFIQWLQQNGFDTSTFTNPGASGNGSGGASANAPLIVRPGQTNLAFASGGKVPGQYVGRDDTLMARVTPGEHIASRKLTAAMEDFFLNGRGSLRIVAGDVYLDGQKVGKHVARGVTDEQERQIGYEIQRG